MWLRDHAKGVEKHSRMMIGRLGFVLLSISAMAVRPRPGISYQPLRRGDMKKQYKITPSRLIFLYIDGRKIGSYFYSKGCEKELENDGYERIVDKMTMWGGKQ